MFFHHLAFSHMRTYQNDSASILAASAEGVIKKTEAFVGLGSSLHSKHGALPLSW